MPNIQIQCKQCSKLIPELYYKLHTSQCSNSTLSPLIASLFMSRINLQIELSSITPFDTNQIWCSKCQQAINKSDICDHIFTCPKITINCIYCKQKVLAENSLQHYQLCIANASLTQNNSKYLEYKQKIQGSKSIRYDIQKQYQVLNIIKKLKIVPSEKRRRDANKYLVQQFKGSRNCQQLSECSLCKSNLQNEQKIVKGRCCHILHQNCHMEWQKKTDQCPKCLKHSF